MVFKQPDGSKRKQDGVTQQRPADVPITPPHPPASIKDLHAHQLKSSDVILKPVEAVPVELADNLLDLFPPKGTPIGAGFIALQASNPKSVPDSVHNAEVKIGAYRGDKLAGFIAATPFDNGAEKILVVNETYAWLEKNPKEDYRIMFVRLVDGVLGEAERRGLDGVNLDGLHDDDAEFFKEMFSGGERGRRVSYGVDDFEGRSGLDVSLRLKIRDPSPPATKQDYYIKPIERVPEYLLDAFRAESSAPPEDVGEIKNAGVKFGLYHQGYLTGFVAANPLGGVLSIAGIYANRICRGETGLGGQTAGEMLMNRLIDESEVRGLAGVDLTGPSPRGLRLFHRMQAKNDALGDRSRLVYSIPPEEGELMYCQIRFKK